MTALGLLADSEPIAGQHWTGVKDKGDHFSDGASLAPVLRQSGEFRRDALFWHYPHYSNAGSPPAGAVREGNWKLLEFFEDDHLELYDLEADPGEKDDLASRMPVLAARLQGRLRGWRAEVGAQMPMPNPDYDPEKAKMKYGLKGPWR